MRKDTKLTTKQQEILLDYFERSLGGESMETVAKEHGYNRSTVSKWANTIHGKELHAEWRTKATQNVKPKYLEVLEARALSGSIKHMELLAKLMDWYPASKQEIITEERKSHGYSEPEVDVNDIRERLKQANGQITRIK